MSVWELRLRLHCQWQLRKNRENIQASLKGECIHLRITYVLYTNFSRIKGRFCVLEDGPTLRCSVEEPLNLNTTIMTKNKEGKGLKRPILVWFVLLSILLTFSFLTMVSALESNGFKWKVVDDPSPSGPSQWVAQNGSLKQLSNIYRTDREYEFYQGTHIVAGSLDWTDYVLSFDMKSADNDGIGAIIRYQDKDNYYRFLMVQDSGNHGPFRHRSEEPRLNSSHRSLSRMPSSA